nr:glycoside hydrolase domain-containing protein [Rhodocytophaga rosea]
MPEPIFGHHRFDIKATYQILLKNANVEGGARPHIAEYKQKATFRARHSKSRSKTKAHAGVSKTLEYACDDYSLAQIAKQLGDTANYRILMRGQKTIKICRSIHQVYARPVGKWRLDHSFQSSVSLLRVYVREANACRSHFMPA